MLWYTVYIQKKEGNAMEYVINLIYDSDAKVWIASNDYIPLTLESESLDNLMSRVKIAAPELIELNGLPHAKYLFFFMQSREEVIA